MNSVLSELGFAARQALIVVPHRQVTRPQRDITSLRENRTAAGMNTDDSGGYFALVKRALSYMNPFSYLGGNGGTSNSEPATSEGYQQYRESSMEL